MTPNARARGLDLSQVQGSPDFAKIQADGYDWVTLKATEGMTFTDPTWDRNVRQAKDAGLLVDGYHFLTAGTPVEAQVKHFADVALGVVDLPPCIDFESPPPEKWIPPTDADFLLARAVEALALTEAAFGRSLVYTYPYFMQQVVKRARNKTNVELLGTRPLWIASYHDEKHAPTLDHEPTIPAPWSDWMFWQWSGDKGLAAPGVQCVVDHDVFNGTRDDLLKLLLPLGEAGTNAIPPPPNA